MESLSMYVTLKVVSSFSSLKIVGKKTLIA